jgi:hypothetical protein
VKKRNLSASDGDLQAQRGNMHTFWMQSWARAGRLS